jgi:UDP-N-acetylmuramate-alanine ligase
MLITGIVNHDESCETVNLVNLILSETGKKISVIDSKIVSELDCKRINDYISELSKNNTDILVLKLSLYDVGKIFLKYIDFDIIIYSEKTDDLNEEEHNYAKMWKKKLFSSLKDKGMAIVNIDDSDLVEYLEKMKCCIITYGFNSKACITTSSIGDTISGNSFLFCQQKNIRTKNGTDIEPQEYKIMVDGDSVNEYDLLAAASFAIVNGIDLNGTLKNRKN